MILPLKETNILDIGQPFNVAQNEEKFTNFTHKQKV